MFARPHNDNLFFVVTVPDQQPLLLEAFGDGAIFRDTARDRNVEELRSPYNRAQSTDVGVVGENYGNGVIRAVEYPFVFIGKPLFPSESTGEDAVLIGVGDRSGLSGGAVRRRLQKKQSMVPRLASIDVLACILDTEGSDQTPQMPPRGEEVVCVGGWGTYFCGVWDVSHGKLTPDSASVFAAAPPPLPFPPAALDGA